MPRHDDPTEIDPRPTPAPTTNGATTAQLKRDHESGALGDKTPMLDPGLATLGTDDEAAGAPPTPEQVAEVRRERKTPSTPRTLDPGAAKNREIGPRVLGFLILLVGLGFAALAVSAATS